MLLLLLLGAELGLGGDEAAGGELEEGEASGERARRCQRRAGQDGSAVDEVWEHGRVQL